MNNVVLMGRLTKDPEVRYSQSQSDTSLCIARYTLAVDRRYKKDGDQGADFIPCKSFGKAGEFAEKYFRKGMKVTISGRIETGSYTNKDGQKVYTTEVIADNQEFAESKGSSQAQTQQPQTQQPTQLPQQDDFMNIPEGIDDELPFN